MVLDLRVKNVNIAVSSDYGDNHRENLISGSLGLRRFLFYLIFCECFNRCLTQPSFSLSFVHTLGLSSGASLIITIIIIIINPLMIWNGLRTTPRVV